MRKNKWKVPPLVGQVVRLDPEWNSYSTYNRGQAKGDPGIITSIHTRRDRNRIDQLTTYRYADINVQWANGHTNSYTTRDVLPIGNFFADLKYYSGLSYTTIYNQIEIETQIMLYGEDTVEVNEESRKKDFSKLLSRADNLYNSSISSSPRSLEDIKASLQKAIDTPEKRIDIDLFFAKANEQWDNNVAAQEMHENLMHFPFEAEEQVFETTTQAEASMPEPPPNVRRDTETYDEYLTRIARDGVEINGFDIEYAMSMGMGVPDNGNPPPQPVQYQQVFRQEHVEEEGGIYRYAPTHPVTGVAARGVEVAVEGSTLSRAMERYISQNQAANASDQEQVGEVNTRLTDDVARTFFGSDDD